MTSTVQIDIAEQRLADRVAKGLGTPYQAHNGTTSNVPIDYGIFTYANLPDAAVVPVGSYAHAVDIGPVWSNGTAWVGSPGHTLAELTVQVPANMPYVLAQANAIEFTAAAATWNSGTRSVATSTGGTKTRLTSDGNHGLSNASDGRYIYVSGTGITAGLYKMTYVSAKVLDIDRAYVAATEPLIGAVAAKSTIYSVSIPAGAMGINGLIDVDLFVECSPTATAKVVSMLFGTSDAGADVALNGTTVYQKHLRSRICNQGSAAAQRVIGLVTDIPSISQATALTKDTAAAQVLAIQAEVIAPDEFIRISSLQVAIFPRA